MTEESQQGPPQQEDRPSSPPSESIPPQPQRSKRNIWIISGAVVGVLCLCSIVCIAVFGASMYKVYTERAPIEAVLDAYMGHMANQDADHAYALFSPRAQRQIPLAEVQAMLEGNNYFLFEGYRSLSVTNINISAAVNTNPDLPQGTVAEVTGVITYEGDIQGSFNGVLEKVGGQWMIDGIYVTVPPSKFK